MFLTFLNDFFQLSSWKFLSNWSQNYVYQTVQLMSLRGRGREKNCSKSSERNLAKNSFLEGLFSPALPVPLGLRNSQMVLVVWYSWAPSKLQLEKQKKRKQVYFRGTLQNTIKGVMHTLKVKKDILWNIHCEYYCEEYFSRILESTSLTFDIMLQVLNL